MKRRLISLALAVTLLAPALSISLTQPALAANDNAAIARLKTLADNEINRRIVTLNSLTKVVAGATHLKDSDRASLTAQLNAELTNLPTLKTKIDGDTDLAMLRTDILSIRAEFRVYVLMVPKVHLIRVADRLLDANTKLTTYADKLQTHIDSAKTAGKDVRSLETTMTDMRSQITTAQSDATSVVSTLLNLTPDQYNASPTIVSNLKSTLKAGRDASAKALQDGNSIRKGLKDLKA